jgi:hypothetical protein
MSQAMTCSIESWGLKFFEFSVHVIMLDETTRTFKKPHSQKSKVPMNGDRED